ncbi:antitoxin [Dietzia kunjamensis]|uniref:antitoxin n=1 Tax=Dietzia kunjamensis TaxID=322509 RepID=UPI002DBF356D|nr:antitoxin [Dietzia kunjamensis]MEB8327195.1 antitoxin [Dietzia kunjamensis]
MGLFDKAKDFAGKNPDKVDSVLDKAGDAFDQRTGGKYAEHTDTAQEKAGDYLTGGTADSPDNPPSEGEQPPA